MRKFSLVLAAAVMAVGLAVSGGASADRVWITEKDAHLILTQGEILYSSGSEALIHIFTVRYGRIYFCSTQSSGDHVVNCWTDETPSWLR